MSDRTSASHAPTSRAPGESSKLRLKAWRRRVTLAILALAAVPLCSAQSATGTQQPNPVAAPTAQSANATPSKPTAVAAPLQDPRQAQLLADTERLLKLSEELKAEVAKTDKDTLSLAVIKKAEEVQQLAKSLRERIGKGH